MGQAEGTRIAPHPQTPVSQLARPPDTRTSLDLLHYSHTRGEGYLGEEERGAFFAFQVE